MGRLPGPKLQVVGDLAHGGDDLAAVLGQVDAEQFGAPADVVAIDALENPAPVLIR